MLFQKASGVWPVRLRSLLACVKVTEAIIRSMTREERARPEIINGSRRTRIARGSGTEVADVNRLIKQFAEMQKMMKRMGALAGPIAGKGKSGKGKQKVNKRQAMRELGDMLGGQGGLPGFPGTDGGQIGRAHV